MIRIFLMYDDQQFCDDLRDYLHLQGDFAICGASPNAMESVKLMPDLVILERSRECDFTVVENLRQAMPGLPLFLVADEVNPDMEKAALSHGVEAVFCKEDDPAALASNARAIYHLVARPQIQ